MNSALTTTSVTSTACRSSARSAPCPPHHRHLSRSAPSPSPRGQTTLAPRPRSNHQLSPTTAAAASSSGHSPITQDTLSRDLIRYYFEVQEPALANRPYSGAVMDFTERAILAYECGYSEEDLRTQLQQCLEGGDCGIKAQYIESFDTSQCLVSIVLVWLTLMASPKTVTRWASANAVSDKTSHQWQGFVGMIVRAYFDKRMAWYSIDRLSMEVTAMGGQPEAPDLVAERARLVFTTLERVYPQFPADT